MSSDPFDERSFDSIKKEKYIPTLNTLGQLFRYFDKHRIYLTDDLCEKIDNFVDELRDPIFDFEAYLDVPASNQALIKEKSIVWREAHNRVREDIPVARKALEDEFRKILGMHENV